MASKSKKNTSYISNKESRKISKFNRSLTRRLDKERNNKKIEPSVYQTKMHNPNNIVEFDNVCSYFFTDIGTVKAADGIRFEIPKCATAGIVG